MIVIINVQLEYISFIVWFMIVSLKELFKQIK